MNALKEKLLLAVNQTFDSIEVSINQLLACLLALFIVNKNLI